MKNLIKRIATPVSDAIFRCRGFEFPAYFNRTHRLHLQVFGLEQDVTRLMKRWLKPGMCVLDIGANIGWLTRIFAAKVGTAGRVIAFEPDPYTRGFLEHNVRGFANITVSPIALSDTDEVSKLHLHPDCGTSNSLINFDSNAETVDVECRTIDSFLEANRQVVPDVIKIDVEGAEPKVLSGMRKTVRRLPELVLVIEFCPENLANGGYDLREYYAQLEGLGLCAEVIHMNGGTTPVSGIEDLMAQLGDKVYCNLLCYRKH